MSQLASVAHSRSDGTWIVDSSLGEFITNLNHSATASGDVTGFITTSEGRR